MKKITIIMAAVVMTVAASIIACNSGKTASKNKEGMEKQTGNQESFSKRGQYLVTGLRFTFF